MIVILDFGSQYTQLIARRIRELGVYSEIKPFYIDIDELRALKPKGIILSGGPSSVYAEDAPIPQPDEQTGRGTDAPYVLIRNMGARTRVKS